jgi:hypothetical protein
MPEPVDRFVILDASASAWRAFASSHPRAGMFHHPAWTDLLREQYGFESRAACLYRAGAIVAGLPYCIVASPFRPRRWVSLPFSDHCVPLASAPSDQALVLENVQRSAAGAQCRLEIRAPSMNVSALTESTTHWLHTTRIDVPADELLMTFHADTRRSIRKAQTAGLTTELRRDIDALASFYRLHTLTRRRLGVPVQPWRYFVLLHRHLLDNDLGFVALTRSGADAVSAGVFCTFNGSTCYKYGASSEARGLANYLMLWDAMKLARQQGSTLFDFGKTSNDNPGLRFFKKKWGSEETPLTYSHWPPSRSNDQPEKALVVRMAGALIRNSPAVVCRLAGEALYKHFAA